MNADPFANEKAFLGVGWSFPVGLDGEHVALARYEEDVHQAILIILGTNPGERLMRPDFGAGLDDFLFESITATTMERIRLRVHEALIDWEPRIDVDEVRVTTTNERNRLDITVCYRVRATNTEHNLVYPFYLDEGTSA